MYGGLLRDGNFFAALIDLDAELCADTRAARCPHCDGALHRSDYPRKPRGGPAMTVERERRFSLCCANCRRRNTPPSVRFLGPKVYYGAVVILAACLAEGVTEWRAKRVAKTLGIPRRTLVRWRSWWQEPFARCRFWAAHRGRFGPPPPTDLPTGLLAAFTGDLPERLLALLRFLAPLTRPGRAP